MRHTGPPGSVWRLYFGAIRGPKPYGRMKSALRIEGHIQKFKLRIDFVPWKWWLSFVKVYRIFCCVPKVEFRAVLREFDAAKCQFGAAHEVLKGV